MDAIPPRATRSPRRREVLAVGAAAGGALLLGGLTAGRARAADSPATVAATGSDPYDHLRGAWSDILTGGGAVNPSDPDYAHAIATVDATADAAIALYDDSATPLAVCRDLPLTHVENASLSYYRLRDTAIAWGTPGSEHQQNPAVAASPRASPAPPARRTSCGSAGEHRQAPVGEDEQGDAERRDHPVHGRPVRTDGGCGTNGASALILHGR